MQHTTYPEVRVIQLNNLSQICPFFTSLILLKLTRQIYFCFCVVLKQIEDSYMSIHVYYLNPDFSCKQLLAAIILSNRLLYSGHGDKLFMFSDSFSIVKILLRLSPIPFPFLQMLQFIVVANIKKFLAIQTLLLPLLLFSTSMID